MNKLAPEKILRYSYLIILTLALSALAYTYYFFYNHVYLTVYFDESRFTELNKKNDALDMLRFNETIRKIDTRMVRKGLEPENIFD